MQRRAPGRRPGRIDTVSDTQDPEEDAMADEGRSADWEEVGRLFGELGRRLQDAWSENRPERPDRPEGETEDGVHVGAVFNELKTSITRTVANPDVRATAGRASTSLADAV